MEQSTEMTGRRYFGRESAWNRSLEIGENIQIENYNADSLFLKLDKPSMEMAMVTTMQKANEIKGQIEFNKLNLGETAMYVTKHEIEWHRKFTLSFACLIFFFIGAPLGAIIRKGGLGAPVVISVVMFIIYYIIDTAGLKMAREGLWTAFQGMWLSSSILLPIGVFLTYKAAVDAVLFNVEEYAKLMQKIRNFIEVKILRMNNVTN
jgi:lipopolysaccharide export system permease protein